MRVTRGAIFDVAVDIRRGSPRFRAARCGRPQRRQLAPALGAARLCAWLLHARGRYRGAIQGDRFLQPGARARRRLGRSGAGDRVADRRRDNGRARSRVAAPVRLKPTSFEYEPMTVIVTGGAGFIGSALVRALVADGERVVTVDKLTYAGSLDNLAPMLDAPHHVFVHADICDRAAMAGGFRRAPAARGLSSCRGEPCRPLDRHARRCASKPTFVGTATLLDAALSLLAHGSMRPGAGNFVFSRSPPTRSMASSARPGSSTTRAAIARARPIRRARPAPTISPAPGTAPTGCRSWFRTARIITGPISFPKS